MNEAAVRDAILATAETFCAASSRSVDENLSGTFPHSVPQPGHCGLRRLPNRLQLLSRRSAGMLPKTQRGVRLREMQLRRVDQSTMEALNSSVFHGIESGGTLLALESGAVSTAVLHGSYR